MWIVLANQQTTNTWLPRRVKKFLSAFATPTEKLTPKGNHSKTSGLVMLEI